MIRLYREEGKDDHTINEFIMDNFELSEDKVKHLIEEFYKPVHVFDRRHYQRYDKRGF